MNLESIKKGNEFRRNISTAYNEYKELEGRKYTGMRVGGIHRWYYDRGEWKEKKVAPDKWEFTYATNKRRAWNAPEGSGASVGTEYYWYILAHQNVRKLDANTYTTSISFVISVTNRNWTFLDLRSYNPFLNSSTPIATDGQV